MNISVTWASYALTVSVCLVLYYCIVFLIFYQKKERVVSTVNSFPDQRPTQPADTKDSYNINLFGEESTPELTKEDTEVKNAKFLSRSFADELEAFTEECGDSIPKEELINGLQDIIQKYPSLKSSETRYQMSQLIAMLAETNCSLHFSAEELGDLWNG